VKQVSYKKFREEVAKSGTLVLSWQDCDKGWMVTYENRSSEKSTWIRTCLYKDTKEEECYKCFVEDTSSVEELKETLEWVNDKWNWEKMKPYWELYDDVSDYYQVLLQEN